MLHLLLLMATTEGGSPLTGLIPVVILVAIFYFLLVAPVRKRQKQQQEMIDNLKTGDKVITSGGICGTVVGISEDRIKVRIADQVKVEVTKSSVASLDDGSED